MDPEKDGIDPAWWAEAFNDPGLEEYEAPELLSTRLERLSKEPDLGELQRLVLEVLASATSAMLKSDDWMSPFAPASDFGSRRSVLPSDLTPEQVTLLARIAPLVEQPDLRARVADVAWLYGDRSDVVMLDAAIDAYRAAPLTDDVWFSIGNGAWHRAFELANRRGADGRTRVEEMTQKLKDHVLAGTVGDRFRIPDCAQMLSGRLSADERTEVAESLVALAAAAVMSTRACRGTWSARQRRGSERRTPRR